MSDHYILIGQTPVPAELLEWARWLDENPESRIVRQTTVLGICWVSTVFLGLDHSIGYSKEDFFPTTMPRQHRPVLFETMAFWEGEGGYEQERCSTWAEAEAQYAAMCREVARPRAVWSYCRRMLGDWWREAKTAWRRGWRDLQGIEPSELEILLDRMEGRQK